MILLNWRSFIDYADSVFLRIPLTAFAWLVAAIVAGGVATGILAGLFGVGGGAIVVPVLNEVFR